MISSTKQELRERVWNAFVEQEQSLFPGPFSRIPNFRVAAAAAARVDELPDLNRIRTVKVNPDLPQRPLRKIHFEQGKTLLVAVPRLRETKCFLLLDPSKISDIHAMTSIGGAAKFGRPVDRMDMPKVEMIVAGSVAVTRRGDRLGKGGGFSDLEYALGRAYGYFPEDTPIVTTVHPLQVLEEDLPHRPHDISVDVIVTPEETIAAATKLSRPKRVIPELFSEGAPVTSSRS
jgi:5-formyltetrahydrofolate cyclo-ligase